MNVYQTVQTSGNFWPPLTAPLLYQASQGTPCRPSAQHGISLFQGLEEQMAEHAAQHEDLLKEVRKHFVLPADSSVIDFLTEHRAIPQILLEAVPWLKRGFGPNAVFHLRAPVDDSGSRTLYAVTMWPGTVRDVRDALEKFDDTWWIACSRRASGYLTFTYELV